MNSSKFFPFLIIIRNYFCLENLALCKYKKILASIRKFIFRVILIISHLFRKFLPGNKIYKYKSFLSFWAKKFRFPKKRKLFKHVDFKHVKSSVRLGLWICLYRNIRKTFFKKIWESSAPWKLVSFFWGNVRNLFKIGFFSKKYGKKFLRKKFDGWGQKVH